MAEIYGPDGSVVSRNANGQRFVPVPTRMEGGGVYKKDPYTDGTGGLRPAMGPTFQEVGSSGLRQFGGWVREEFLPQLVGRQASRVYREMWDNSPTVGALVFSVMQTMRSIDWSCTPANDSPAAAKEAEFADSLRLDMSNSWEDFMSEALTMLIFGYAPHEIVYKRRNGRVSINPEVPTSKYNDGRIGIRKMPIRGQDTVLKWFFGFNGEITGLTQQPWVGPLIDIPIEKLLIFRPLAHKNNPEGRSILRSAYVPYFFIKRLQEQEAILFERMSGFPVIYVPNALLEGAAAGDKNSAAALAAYKQLITNVRIDEQMGIILPSDPWDGMSGPTSQRMYEFKLETPQGRINAQFHVAIERYKLDILMTALADFILLGHSTRGTQNLALAKVDMFYQAIEGWVDGIASVLNKHMLPRIWKLNGLDQDLMPQYEPSLAQRVDLDSLGNFLLHLSQAGDPMFPDEDLDQYIRDAAGLPDARDSGARNAAGSDPAVLKRMLRGTYARIIKGMRHP